MYNNYNLMYDIKIKLIVMNQNHFFKYFIF